MNLRALLCRFLGHQWRRLRKGEGPKNYLVAELGMGRNIRVCSRCGVQRWAQPRKRKVTS